MIRVNSWTDEENAIVADVLDRNAPCSEFVSLYKEKFGKKRTTDSIKTKYYDDRRKRAGQPIKHKALGVFEARDIQLSKLKKAGVLIGDAVKLMLEVARAL